MDGRKISSVVLDDKTEVQGDVFVEGIPPSLAYRKRHLEVFGNQGQSFKRLVYN